MAKYDTTRTDIDTRNTVFRVDTGEPWAINLHVIRAEHNNYVIDTGIDGKCLEPVLRLLEGQGKPTVVINTHWHFDHILGNHMFPASLIVAHETCRATIEENWESLVRDMPSGMLPVHKCLPNLTFADKLSFAEDGIRLAYTPGHTPDGICVIDEKSGVINVGDNIGDTLEEMVPFLECDTALFVKSVQYYLDTGCETFVTGHNVLLNRAQVEALLREISM